MIFMCDSKIHLKNVSIYMIEMVTRNVGVHRCVGNSSGNIKRESDINVIFSLSLSQPVSFHISISFLSAEQDNRCERTHDSVMLYSYEQMSKRKRI